MKDIDRAIKRLLVVFENKVVLEGRDWDAKEITRGIRELSRSFMVVAEGKWMGKRSKEGEDRPNVVINIGQNVIDLPEPKRVDMLSVNDSRDRDDVIDLLPEPGSESSED